MVAEVLSLARNSIGGVRTDAAREALQQIVDDASLEARVRQYASREIERSFA